MNHFEKLNGIFSHKYFQAALVPLFAYLVLPTYLSGASYLCEHEKPTFTNCLDASWVTSLHWALEKNLVFGRDYLFTYGPLGILSTRTAAGFNPLYFLLSDIFIVANLAFILIYAFRRFRNLPALIFCLLIAYATAGGVGMYSDQIVFTFLLISVFWLNYSLEHSKAGALVIPVLVTVGLFFIKVNISFVGLALFYLYLLFFIFSVKENRLVTILIGLSVPVLILFLSFPLNTDISGYVAGGLSLIDGYNDAMSIKMGNYLKFLIVALILLAVFPAVFFLKNPRHDLRRNLLLLLTFGIFSFVLFKQSFVRSDLHVAIFFTFFPAICGLLLIFYRKISMLQAATAFGILLACLACGMTIFDYAKIGDRLNYLSAVFHPDDLAEQRYKNGFERFRLPPETLEIIGTKSVDIIPWNIDYLYFNRLNYNPRPVIQSYSAYTPYLIDLNAEKYAGASAPEVVIYSNASIDERYPLFDDQPAKLALIRDYSCHGLSVSETGGNFLLFRRNPGAGGASDTLNFSEPVEEMIKFNDHYFLKDTGKSYFIKIEIEYNLFGKAVRALYKPFPITINFTLEDGTTRRYRAVVPILKSGVLINPLVENELDFLNLAQGTEIPPNKRIKSFRLDLDAPAGAAGRIAWKTLKPVIKLRISEMSVERKPE